MKIPSLSARPARRASTVESSADELVDDLDTDTDSDLSLARRQRRSTRAAAVTANRKLGNQPNPKTRSGRQVLVVHGSDSDSEVQEISRATRKSTRARKSKRSNLDDEDFEDMDFVDDESDVLRGSKSKASKKKVVRGKASRPAYGHFRVVADLQYDDEDDDDSAPLYAHRSVCEKCHTQPAHEQLKKAAKRGKKRRRNEDDESEDEESRLNALGGWVRW